ncbi:DUF559 domain-containing protein [Microbacterium sp. G2-8]|uniref:DUF559 domain-containing protein n=1 Tax=Microbacterium sp. G2-8 TaxID=2842454 RepID=UPI001C8A676C|nr:DUF559 domain-containing protein [Microbacterium sp. G2-8]
MPDKRLRASDLRRPFHAVRTRRTPPTTLIDACAELAPLLRPWQFFSHDTALALHGSPLPPSADPLALHVSAHRPHSQPRTAGIHGHRLQRRELAAEPCRSGFLVESPVRAWRQVGYRWPHDDLVAAADALLARASPLCTWEELSSEIEDMGDMRGRILRSALQSARDGSESARETKLRLALARFGLPEPELNWELVDHRGTFVARFDMAYRRWRVAVEYDGRQHAFDTAQFERDADRWDAVRAEGWVLVRILNHHLRGDPPRGPAMVRDALRERGWFG